MLAELLQECSGINSHGYHGIKVFHLRMLQHATLLKTYQSTLKLTASLVLKKGKGTGWFKEGSIDHLPHPANLNNLTTHLMSSCWLWTNANGSPKRGVLKIHSIQLAISQRYWPKFSPCPGFDCWEKNLGFGPCRQRLGAVICGGYTPFFCTKTCAASKKSMTSRKFMACYLIP